MDGPGDSRRPTKPNVQSGGSRATESKFNAARAQGNPTPAGSSQSQGKARPSSVAHLYRRLDDLNAMSTPESSGHKSGTSAPAVQSKARYFRTFFGQLEQQQHLAAQEQQSQLQGHPLHMDIDEENAQGRKVQENPFFIPGQDQTVESVRHYHQHDPLHHFSMDLRAPIQDREVIPGQPNEIQRQAGIVHADSRPLPQVQGASTAFETSTPVGVVMLPKFNVPNVYLQMKPVFQACVVIIYLVRKLSDLVANGRNGYQDLSEFDKAFAAFSPFVTSKMTKSSSWKTLEQLRNRSADVFNSVKKSNTRPSDKHRKILDAVQADLQKLNGKLRAKQVWVQEQVVQQQPVDVEGAKFNCIVFGTEAAQSMVKELESIKDDFARGYAELKSWIDEAKIFFDVHPDEPVLPECHGMAEIDAWLADLCEAVPSAIEHFSHLVQWVMPELMKSMKGDEDPALWVGVFAAMHAVIVTIQKQVVPAYFGSWILQLKTRYMPTYKLWTEANPEDFWNYWQPVHDCMLNLLHIPKDGPYLHYPVSKDYKDNEPTGSDLGGTEDDELALPPTPEPGTETDADAVY